MSFVDDLAKATNVMNTGFAQLDQAQSQIRNSQVVEQATKAARDIRDSTLKDNEKRMEFRKLSDTLVSELVGSADTATIQALAQQLSPVSPRPQTSLQTQLFGTEEQKQTDVAFRAEEEARDHRLLRAQEDIAIAKEDRKATRGTPVSKEVLKVVTDADSQLGNAEAILAKLEADPSLAGVAAGRVPFRSKISGDFAAFESGVGRFFDQYRKFVTGAQASEKEIAFLETRVPRVTDSVTEFKAKMKDIIKQANRLRRQTLINARKAGQDVSGFLESERAATPGRSTAARQRSQGIPQPETLDSELKKSLGFKWNASFQGK